LLAGEPARAEEMTRSALATLEALGETVNSAALAASLAEALCRQGKFEGAETISEASERAAWPDDLRAQVGWRATRAQALAACGQARQGEQLAREALAQGERESPLGGADASAHGRVCLSGAITCRLR
jgi:hypothetical protein